MLKKLISLCLLLSAICAVMTPFDVVRAASSVNYSSILTGSNNSNLVQVVGSSSIITLTVTDTVDGSEPQPEIPVVSHWFATDVSTENSSEVVTLPTPIFTPTVFVSVTVPSASAPPVASTTPVAAPPTPKLPPVYEVGVVSQADPAQYKSSDQFSLWRVSACSAAALTSVLVAYGVPIKLGNMLDIMSKAGVISPWLGLSDNNGFIPVAAHFGFTATVDRNPNIDEHFNSIMAHIQANQPVIVNLKNGYYYPNGHFVVAFHTNNAGLVEIMNPDWQGTYPPGLQIWTVSQLKAFFSNSPLSVILSK